MKINLLRVIQVTVLMAFYFDTLSLKAEDIFQKKCFHQILQSSLQTLETHYVLVTSEVREGVLSEKSEVLKM